MTAALFGLSSLHEYYNDCSNRDKMHKIQKLLVCITSEDDLFVPKECKFAESHVHCGGNDTISISFFVERDSGNNTILSSQEVTNMYNRITKIVNICILYLFFSLQPFS